MPVDSQHSEYTKRILRWEKNRDAYEGEDEVKSKSKRYLVAPGGFTQTDYDRYVARAKWFGGTTRTISGLTGAVFQKEPVIAASDAVLEQIGDATLSNMSMNLLASTVLSDVLLLGRYGVVLDYETELRRPYLSGFPAENIINWKIARINGKMMLTMIVIKECYSIEKDKYQTDDVYYYRVLYLNENGIYEVDVYDKSDLNKYSMVNSYVPTRRGRTLNFIPFQFFGVHDLTPSVFRGPLDDLVNADYSYYRHSADFEHGLFLTGVPTPVITGHNIDEGEPLTIGSLAAWVLPDPEAKAYMLEYQGHGLQAHERAMEVDKREMATQGARLLESQPDTAETLGAVQLRHSGEQGSLKATTNLISEGLTRLLRWYHWWNGETEDLSNDEYSYMLNTDFSITRLNPQEIQALMAVWQGGGISQETFFWNLKQGEIIPDERTYEDEQGMIEANAPARLPFDDTEVDDSGGSDAG